MTDTQFRKGDVVSDVSSNSREWTIRDIDPQNGNLHFDGLACDYPSYSFKLVYRPPTREEYESTLPVVKAALALEDAADVYYALAKLLAAVRAFKEAKNTSA